MKFTELNTGIKMPLFGLGTYGLVGHDVLYNALDAALKSGYRLIDTAAVYKNEKDIGDCLRELLPKHGLSRDDLFLETKLDTKDHGLEEAYSACLASLEKLQTDYLDLYIIHWPAKSKIKSDDPRHAGFRKDSWTALEKLYKEGKVRNIGISNYTLKHLKEMASYTTIQPAVLQTDLLQWCQANNVHLQTYRSLGKSKLLSEPVVVTIAERTNKTPAQVLLQWALQQDLGRWTSRQLAKLICVIPQSTNPDHIAENIDIFEHGDNWLTEEDMLNISDLHCGEKFCWDPSVVP
ncbi:uncharacterized protein LOC110976478 isoform X2 [Acanthaster planci]|uniref:Uncharacterized protein LOC110976478 isoform X2 n=1 Tax=Acanthaster planci TaxID=133434 RepID=A0A8B7XZK8_ACAPL|nr:uncharacterized protein LOC110976478 isoform X2 [Acanthaster planci]